MQTVKIAQQKIGATQMCSRAKTAAILTCRLLADLKMVGEPFFAEMITLATEEMQGVCLFVQQTSPDRAGR